MKKRAFHFGFSTILISFVMICIVTFCALALLPANADYRLSQKVADRTSDYYAAEESAFHKLSDIDRMLSDCYKSSASSEEYDEAALESALAYADENTEITVSTDDGTVLSWEESYDDSHKLAVSVKVSRPSENNGKCILVTEWKTVSEAPEINEDNETLDLIGKEISYER
jgi:cellulose synthase/poly-beta-1,6-N-acetylglucosamine synthase-like glycosyltransferase